LLRMKQEAIEHAKLRAIAQIIIDKEKGAEAFEEYMKLAFPYAEATKRREKDHYIKMLNDEISKGSLRVTPMENPVMRSKIATAKSKKKGNAALTRSIGRKLSY